MLTSFIILNLPTIFTETSLVPCVSISTDKCDSFFCTENTNYALRIPDSYDAKICKSACNSANNPSFQNLTKSLFAQCSIDVKSAVTF